MTKFEFHVALSESFVANDQVIGSTDQVSIIELDPRPFITIIPQHFNASILQCGIEGFSQLRNRLGLAEGQERDVKRRDRDRPLDAFGIVILLDRGCGGAADTDSITAHHS